MKVGPLKLSIILALSYFTLNYLIGWNTVSPTTDTVHELVFIVPFIYVGYLSVEINKMNDIVEIMGCDAYGIYPTLLFACTIVLLREDMSAASNYWR